MGFFDKKHTSKVDKKTPPTDQKVVKSIDSTTKSVRNTKVTAPDDTTQRYLPFYEVRDNVIYMKDGSARVILKVETVNFALKSEQEQDAIIYSYQRFLNTLRFPVQILVRSLKVDLEGYVNRLETMAAGQKNYLLKEQTIRYVEFLNNLVEVAQIMKKEFYIVVPHDETFDISDNQNGIFANIKKFIAAVFGQKQDLNAAKVLRSKAEILKRKVYEKASIIRSALEQIGLKSRMMNKHEVIELMISYYNPKLDSVTQMADTVDHMDFADA